MKCAARALLRFKEKGLQLFIAVFSIEKLILNPGTLPLKLMCGLDNGDPFILF